MLPVMMYTYIRVASDGLGGFFGRVRCETRKFRPCDNAKQDGQAGGCSDVTAPERKDVVIVTSPLVSPGTTLDEPMAHEDNTDEQRAYVGRGHTHRVRAR